MVSTDESLSPRPRAVRTRTLIALGAMSLASAGAWAQPQTSFYGLLDVYAGVHKPQIGQSSLVIDSSGMATSYAGAKLTDQLTDGVTGLAVLEAFITPTTGDYGRFSGDHFFARDAFIGVEGAYGTLTGGRVTSRFFVSTLLFNPFFDSFVFSPIILQTYMAGGALDGDSGWSRSVVYDSPKFADFSGSLSYSAGEVAGHAGVNNYSVTLMYAHGPFAATAAAEKVDLAPSPFSDDSQKSVLIGASYDLKLAKLYAEYLNVKDSAGIEGNVTRNIVQGGVGVPIGPGSLMLSYAHTSGSDAMRITRDTESAGYDYNVSKSLDLYVAYAHDREKGSANGFWTPVLASSTQGGIFGIGGRYKF